MKSILTFLIAIGFCAIIVVENSISQTRRREVNILQSGVIAFSITPPNSNNEIYIMNSDGSNLQQITYSPERDAGPAWSPDGKEIAFYVHSDSTWSIFKMNADGSERQQLTHRPGYWSHKPTWSSYGELIAFASEQGETREIWLMGADGSNQQKINSVSGTCPDFSPDGLQIAYQSSWDNSAEILITNLNGTYQETLTNNNSEDLWPNWSPDGTKIVFSSNRDGNREIYIMNSDGSDQTRLTFNEAIDAEPDWSSDGSQIVFSSFRDGNYEIYIMNANGTNQTRLTHTNGHAIQPDWYPMVSSGVGENEIGRNLLRTFELFQNFPNPFNPLTTIEFSIPTSELVQLSVFNILGEEVRKLVNKERSAGKHSIQFNASQLASGMYLYRLQAGSFIETKKMILLK